MVLRRYPGTRSVLSSDVSAPPITSPIPPRSALSPPSFPYDDDDHEGDGADDDGNHDDNDDHDDNENVDVDVDDDEE